MSYCRVSEDNSDVYVLGTAESLECCGCDLQEEPWWRHVQQWAVNWIDGWLTVVDGLIKIATLGLYYPSLGYKWVLFRTKQKWGTFTRSFRTNSREEMIDHLRDHRAAGHQVPQEAIERLYDEINDRGDRY